MAPRSIPVLALALLGGCIATDFDFDSHDRVLENSIQETTVDDMSVDTATKIDPDSETSFDHKNEVLDDRTWNVAADEPVQLMILAEASGLPGGFATPVDRWEELRKGLEGFTGRVDDRLIQLGFFPYPLLVPNADPCEVPSGPLLDSLPLQHERLLAHLEELEPQGKAPLLATLAAVSDPKTAPGFHAAADGRKLLAVITSAGEGCTGQASATQTAFALAAASRDLVDQGIEPAAIAFGTNTSQLTGKPLGQDLGLFAAKDAMSLTEALFAALGRNSALCRFEMSAEDAAEAYGRTTSLYLDDKSVPYVEGCDAQSGWTFEGPARRRIRLCAETCGRVASGRIETIRLAWRRDNSLEPWS